MTLPCCRPGRGGSGWRRRTRWWRRASSAAPGRGRRSWAGRGGGGAALAVNVSDLGAMGAAPLGALVCAALPPEVECEWVEALYAGLRDCAGAYGCPVVGGDTVRSPGPVVLSVTALGSVAAGRAVLRS